MTCSLTIEDYELLNTAIELYASSSSSNPLSGFRHSYIQTYRPGQAILPPSFPLLPQGITCHAMPRSSPSPPATQGLCNKPPIEE